MRLTRIEGTVLDFRQFDLLAAGDTAVHRLDPRAKVLVVLVYIVTVVSFGRYEVSAMLPFFFFPLAMLLQAELPMAFMLKKTILVVPFVVMIGISNPYFDRQIQLCLGSIAISGGWLSLASMLVRAVLTVSAAFLLVAITGFTAMCEALRRLGMPEPLVTQLLVMYRYLFVLIDEGTRISSARDLRSCGDKGKGIRSFSALVASLLIRSWERSERITMAMRARGFTGRFRCGQHYHFGVTEYRFVAGWVMLFILLRVINFPLAAGKLISGFILAGG